MQTFGTAHLIFWGLALGMMTVAVAYAVLGWRTARAGDFDTHRRQMIRACLWIVAFLVAYLAKVAWLGHEDLAHWSPLRHLVINVHRSIVFAMLGLGGFAWVLGSRVLPRRDDLKNVHRWLGRGALIAGILGLATATIVFWQMLAAAAQP